MKRLMSKLACAALGLSLCFGAVASPRIPVALAPVSSLSVVKPPVVSRFVYIIVVITDLPWAHTLEHVNQSAEFDSTK